MACLGLVLQGLLCFLAQKGYAAIMPKRVMSNASVMASTQGVKLIMGMDIDYPPYAYLRKEPYLSSNDLDEIVGVGADMIKGMAKHCNFDVVITQADWNDCWGVNEIG